MPSSADRPTGPLHSAIQPTQPLNGSPGDPQPVDRMVTRSLSVPPPIFGPLPEGALIGPDRYEVLEVRQGENVPYLYLVQSRAAVRLCPNPDCSAVVARLDEEFCSTCGMDLTSVEPARLRYLAREAPEMAQLGPEATLAQLRLANPAIYGPLEFFMDEGPGGAPRAYVILPEPVGVVASLTLPQEPLTVAAWGAQLARGLATLHQNDVALGTMDPQHVVVDKYGAHWVDFSTAVIQSGPGAGNRLSKDTAAPPADSSAHAPFVEDIRNLAGLLRYLMTGQSAQVDAPLPAPLSAVFTRAFQQGFTNASDFVQALETAVTEARHPNGLRIQSGRLSDIGRVRHLNEDSLFVLEIERVNQSHAERIGIYAVADGMGGHSAGELASGLIVDAIHSYTMQRFPLSLDDGLDQASVDYQQWLKDAFQAANRLVVEQRRHQGTDMGSTLVIAVVTGTCAYLGNIGDSRIYRINDQGIQQLTVDHSLVQRLVDAGQITAEEARKHAQKNVIYRTIGERIPIEPDITALPLEPGDRLLLCSDGLSGMLTDEAIRYLVLAAASPQEACRALIDAANQAGGEDNITAIVVQVAEG